MEKKYNIIYIYLYNESNLKKYVESINNFSTKTLIDKKSKFEI